LLQKAKEKREAILLDFQKENVDINPLVLIQLKKDDATEVKELLDTLGVKPTEVGVWLSGEKKNIDRITEPNSPVSYLICNQAIAMGWDCPRAHILVQMLKASEDFSEQVIGRVLRTVERKIYHNNNLDNAFVYTITHREEAEKIEEKVKTIHDVQYDMKLVETFKIDEINELVKHLQSEHFDTMGSDDVVKNHFKELRSQIKNQAQKKLSDLSEASEVEIEIKTGAIETQDLSLQTLVAQESSQKEN